MTIHGYHVNNIPPLYTPLSSPQTIHSLDFQCLMKKSGRAWYQKIEVTMLFFLVLTHSLLGFFKFLLSTCVLHFNTLQALQPHLQATAFSKMVVQGNRQTAQRVVYTTSFSYSTGVVIIVVLSTQSVHLPWTSNLKYYSVHVPLMAKLRTCDTFVWPCLIFFTLHTVTNDISHGTFDTRPSILFFLLKP